MPVLAYVMSLYQIYYKEDHKKHLYPFAIPVFNEGLTIFFENKVISEVVNASNDEKIAVASWKLNQKSRRIHPITPEALNSTYQVLSFTRNSGRHTMMAMAKQWHVDFIPAIDMLWNKLGLKRPGEAKHPIYQNHYSATAEIYKDYVTNFLDPAMKLITEDPDLNEIMKRPSGYGRLSRDADMRSVKEKLGMSDYPLCPFVLERCPSLFMTMKNIPVTYL
jgi:hypothetical protein